MPMKVIELLNKKNADAFNHKPVTIGFLGDSVTNGCFETVPSRTESGEETFDVVYEPENSYSADLRKLLLRLYPKAQVNIVNAGISGDNALNGLDRMERDLLCCNPDLTVVCFGLNDCTLGEDGLERYRKALAGIVQKLKAAGSEVILMTPQPICTRVHGQLRGEDLYKTGQILTELFHNGVFDKYMDTMRSVAKEEGVALCDAYAKWMVMYKNGVDVTDMLSNFLNHPTRDMHWLFAISLAETMFAG